MSLFVVERITHEIIVRIRIVQNWVMDEISFILNFWLVTTLLDGLLLAISVIRLTLSDELWLHQCTGARMLLTLLSCHLLKLAQYICWVCWCKQSIWLLRFRWLTRRWFDEHRLTLILVAEFSKIWDHFKHLGFVYTTLIGVIHGSKYLVDGLITKNQTWTFKIQNVRRMGQGIVSKLNLV